MYSYSYQLIKGYLLTKLMLLTLPLLTLNCYKSEVMPRRYPTGDTSQYLNNINIVMFDSLSPLVDNPTLKIGSQKTILNLQR